MNGLMDREARVASTGFMLLKRVIALACAYLLAGSALAQESPPPPLAKHFETPEQAAQALIDAAGEFDVDAMKALFGPHGEDVFLSGERQRDRQRALDFAAKAAEKNTVSTAPDGAQRAFLVVGADYWPFPVPIVKSSEGWAFDAAAGRQELLNRRIGANELDAIALCRGYVEAQYAYAFQKRDGYGGHQYAQRIIATPGKRDGLAWQNSDGSWGGPVGQNIARAIAQGYRSGAEPYHGYFFKTLKGQGPAATPHGEMDFVVRGAMIGGFALAAAPAEYGKTGVKTFIVSHAGVVYEKDLGPTSLEAFRKMERFNPDASWTAIPEKKSPAKKGPENKPPENKAPEENDK
jgi:hypothetical protein